VLAFLCLQGTAPPYVAHAGWQTSILDDEFVLHRRRCWTRVATSGGQFKEKTGVPLHHSLCPSTGDPCPRARPKRQCGWMREGVAASRSWGTVTFLLDFRCKFLFSCALSARKSTPAKAHNTAHFHVRLHYVHPTLGNTKPGQLLSRSGLRRDAEQTEGQTTGRTGKMGRVATLTHAGHVASHRRSRLSWWRSRCDAGLERLAVRRHRVAVTARRSAALSTANC